VEVTPDEGPRGFARATDQLVEELDQQEDEGKLAEMLLEGASVPEGT